MPASTRRAIVLFALVLGVIAMHHANVPDFHAGTADAAVERAEPAPATAFETIGDLEEQHHACAHCGAHLLPHPCLAVLDGAMPVLLAPAAALEFPQPVTAADPRGSPRPHHTPGRGGRAVITSVCVLRV